MVAEMTWKNILDFEQDIEIDIWHFIRNLLARIRHYAQEEKRKKIKSLNLKFISIGTCLSNLNVVG
ncbi:CLUMA_CG004226, isoform A [Clunio marinus]|uniref:CLUMA_CG004226, isoform A n=1 Tax=Clunio marinus TaxID=568069 RepID=A0A1J1HR58_9DIPT|nr:CLUMA_CG004226, isoform A [Clunio marinus]